MASKHQDGDFKNTHCKAHKSVDDLTVGSIYYIPLTQWTEQERNYSFCHFCNVFIFTTA